MSDCNKEVRPQNRSKALDRQSSSGNLVRLQKVAACAKRPKTPAGSVFAAKQLAPQDLSVLTVLSTAAAQQEDLFDCLASCSKPTQAKTEHLHMACKDAVSAFKSQESHETQNVNEYLRAATAVAFIPSHCFPISCWLHCIHAQGWLRPPLKSCCLLFRSSNRVLFLFFELHHCMFPRQQAQCSIEQPLCLPAALHQVALGLRVHQQCCTIWLNHFQFASGVQ